MEKLAIKKLAAVAAVAFSLLLAVAPAYALPTWPPQPPSGEPIYIFARGNATLLSSTEKVVADAQFYMVGELRYSRWLPLSGRGLGAKSAWIGIKQLTVTVGTSQFELKGYGTLVKGRLMLFGWSAQATLFIRGEVSPDNSTQLSGVIR